jgi:branched-chain amino acid transport system substrate-binding protein
MTTPLPRRTFLKGALAAGAFVGLPSLAACSKSPATGGGGGGGGADAGGGQELTVVALSEFTGIYAELGEEIRQGVELAKEEYNGEVGDFGLKFVYGETNAQTDEAVRQVRENIEKGNTLFMGTQLSNIALAISTEVNRGGGVFCTLAGAPEITGEQCKTSTFRWSNNTYTAGHETVNAVMKAEPDLKKWFCVTPDYVFGKALLESTTEAVKANGGQVLGNAYHATQETEFSSYLNNAAASGADVLAILNVGGQTINTVKQAISFGLNKRMKIVIVWSTGLTQFRAIGANNMADVYAGAQYWHGVDTPNNKMLVEAVQKKYQINPGYGLAAAYYQVKAMLDGVTNAGSSKSSDIIEAMVSKPFKGVTGDEVFRADDHQLLKDYYVLVGKPAGQAKEDDMMEVVHAGGEPMPVEQTGCNLTPLGQ